MPYEVERYERMVVDFKAPPQLTEVHPLGKSPVIEDEDAEIVLGESSAIISEIFSPIDDIVN